MKKGISMILVLALSAMMLVGCGGGVAGTYKMTKAEKDGKEMDLEALSALVGQDFEVSITLKDDGKVEMSSKMGDKEDNETGTWTEDGDKITIKSDKGGSSQTLTVEDGKLYMETNGMKLILEK